MSDPASTLLTLSQVAVRTGRHPELLRQWCAAGRVPCQRLGGSWVLREADLELVERMASRGRRRSAPSTAAPSGRTHLIAAVFDDADHAAGAADALRRRLGLTDGALETAPLTLPSLASLALTVVAGQIPAEAIIAARRIVSSFGGRIVADLYGEEPATTPARRARGVARQRVAARA